MSLRNLTPLAHTVLDAGQSGMVMVIVSAGPGATYTGHADGTSGATTQDYIELLSGEEYAVPALLRKEGKSFSATTMRDLISDLVEDPNNQNALSDLREFVPEDKIKILFSSP